MSKNTSILIDDYFDNFIKKQVKTGKYTSASEVVRVALRLFEHEETKKEELIKELEKGEKSGFGKKGRYNAFYLYLAKENKWKLYQSSNRHYFKRILFI